MEDRKTLAEWASEYRGITGSELNMGTLRKRRAVCGVGRLIPPKTYILTKKEFAKVLETPLPMCNMVIGVDPRFMRVSA